MGLEPTTSRATIWHSSHLNYTHRVYSVRYQIFKLPEFFGEPGGIRTPDLRLRRPLLYPTELLIHAAFGAGDGNRTHATSLEGWCSTIELHPQIINICTRLISITTFDFNVKQFLQFRLAFLKKYFVECQAGILIKFNIDLYNI